MAKRQYQQRQQSSVAGGIEISANKMKSATAAAWREQAAAANKQHHARTLPRAAPPRAARRAQRWHAHHRAPLVARVIEKKKGVMTKIVAYQQ